MKSLKIEELLKKYPIDSKFIYKTAYGGILLLKVYCLDETFIYVKTFNNDNIKNYYSYNNCEPLYRELKLNRILKLKPKKIKHEKDMSQLNELRLNVLNLEKDLISASSFVKPTILTNLIIARKKLKQFDQKFVK